MLPPSPRSRFFGRCGLCTQHVLHLRLSFSLGPHSSERASRGQPRNDQERHGFTTSHAQNQAMSLRSRLQTRLSAFSASWVGTSSTLAFSSSTRPAALHRAPRRRAPNPPQASQLSDRLRSARGLRPVLRRPGLPTSDPRGHDRGPRPTFSTRRVAPARGRGIKGASSAPSRALRSGGRQSRPENSRALIQSRFSTAMLGSLGQRAISMSQPSSRLDPPKKLWDPSQAH